MNHGHLVAIGFFGAFVGMLIRSALKNYANISL